MSASFDKLRLFDSAHDGASFELRDFLTRSVVAFDYERLVDDEACRTWLGTSLSEARLPVVLLPDGTRLSNPSLHELAQCLGWVTRPRFHDYDLSIYGAGPAGLSAAVYAASEGLRTVLVERNAVGGQAGSSSLIENFFGFPSGISGAELAERARQQALKFGVEILQMREGIRAEFRDGRIFVDLADGSKLVAKANICATGVEWRRLGVPEESAFLGRGLFYSAGLSEAVHCGGERVFVVGGANSAGQAAVHLAAHGAAVVMLVRGASFKGTMSRYLSERILSHPSIQVRFTAEVSAFDGARSLERVEVRDVVGGRAEWLEASRVFACIGGMPNTDWSRETPIVRDQDGYLVTGADLLEAGKPPMCWTLKRLPFFLETSVPGSFAVGDVRSGSVKRLATAVGEGAMAITFVHRHLAEAGG